MYYRRCVFLNGAGCRLFLFSVFCFLQIRKVYRKGYSSFLPLLSFYFYLLSFIFLPGMLSPRQSQQKSYVTIYVCYIYDHLRLFTICHNQIIRSGFFKVKKMDSFTIKLKNPIIKSKLIDNYYFKSSFLMFVHF